MYAKVWKRFGDMIISFVGLTVLSPFLLVLMVTGAVIMRGNPFFVQVRPGKDEKLFRMVKFRSMTNQKDSQGNLLPDEMRLTGYGRFLRETSLDELPELFNVLKGDMSLVGPRPQLVRDMVFMTPGQRQRHTVAQGMTGLAQVSGRNRMTWEQKIDYDLCYLEKISLAHDVKILLRTVGKVFCRDGISAQGMDTAEDLGDYLLRTGQVSREEYDQKQQQARKLLEPEQHRLYQMPWIEQNDRAQADAFLRQCEPESFCPVPWRLFLPGERLSLKSGLLRLYYSCATGGKCRVFGLRYKDALVHTACVVPRCGKFPFLKDKEYHIGPCVTAPAYRRRGCYAHMLRHITTLTDYAGSRFYIIVRDRNIPSIRGVEKVGFVFCGTIAVSRWGKRYQSQQSGAVPGWRHYHGGWLPDCPPDGRPDTSAVTSGEIWKAPAGRALLARWTEDFDCPEPTEWWYVLRSEPFQTSVLRARKRYKINRGQRYFLVRQIDPEAHLEELFRVQRLAYQAYPKKYRPLADKAKLDRRIRQEWTAPGSVVFGAFRRDTGRLEGYIQMSENGRCIHSNIQKANPEQEKYNLHYALLAAALEYWNPKLAQGSYVSVGERNILHETRFQDFVVENFGFRKAYCRLRIAYHPAIRWLIPVLYPLRPVLKKLDGIGFLHKISGVLQMEEICRRQEKVV